MLSFLTSSANALVKVAKNAFVPEYVASMGDGMEPAKDPIFKIKPRFLQMFKILFRSLICNVHTV